MSSFEVSEEVEFAASHQVRFGKEGCEALHGHNYRVRVTVRAESLDATSYVMDFAALRRALAAAVAPLDHRHLNDVPPFTEINPTAECIARYVYEALAPKIDDARARVTLVEVFETPRSRAAYAPGA